MSTQDDMRQERIDAVLHQRSEFADYARKNTRPMEWSMTESQRRERALMEIRMRNGSLRHPPSIFGGL